MPASRSVAFQAPAASLHLTVTGDGPPVLLIPSLGRGGSDFDRLAGDLAAAGFRAVAIDPRGINGSTGPMEGLTLHDYAADFAAVVEALDHGPVDIVGHAWGNRTARCLAADRPDLVRSVTLLAAGGLVEPEPRVSAALGRCFNLALPAAERFEAIRLAFFAPGHDLAIWTDGWWPGAATSQGAATRATPRDDWWGAGTAPLHVIQGLDDLVALPANGRALREAFGNRVRLVELPAAGHALLPEQPEAIAAALIAFLRDTGEPAQTEARA